MAQVTGATDGTQMGLAFAAPQSAATTRTDGTSTAAAASAAREIAAGRASARCC